MGEGDENDKDEDTLVPQESDQNMSEEHNHEIEVGGCLVGRVLMVFYLTYVQAYKIMAQNQAAL